MQSFETLAVAFEEQLAKDGILNAQPANLYEPCNYLLALPGKRVRPILCLMGAELYSPINEDAHHAAMAVELFHNFTLLHDDIMDKAPLRRGMPTVHERYGLTAGILCGDALSMYAFSELAKVKTNTRAILQLFSKTAIEVCEGQQWDMDFETRDDVAEEDYIHMISLKTSVLLAAALKMGALIGGATEGAAQMLYAFGKNLGIAFQLQDDYLDSYGKSQSVGKKIGGDIMANKKTFLQIATQANANEDQVKALAELRKRNDEGKITEMLSLYTATGADAHCRDAVSKYSDAAFACLEDVAVQSVRKEELKKLAVALLGREK